MTKLEKIVFKVSLVLGVSFFGFIFYNLPYNEKMDILNQVIALLFVVLGLLCIAYNDVSKNESKNESKK